MHVFTNSENTFAVTEDLSCTPVLPGEVEPGWRYAVFCICKHPLISLLSNWNSEAMGATLPWIKRQTTVLQSAGASTSGSAGCDTGRFVCLVPTFVISAGSLASLEGWGQKHYSFYKVVLIFGQRVKPVHFIYHQDTEFRLNLGLPESNPGSCQDAVAAACLSGWFTLALVALVPFFKSNCLLLELIKI